MRQGNKSLKQLAAEFINSLKVRNMAKRTIKFQRWKLGKFLIFLDQRSIEKPDQISKVIIFDYQTELYHTINNRGRPNSVSSQNNMLATVKSFTAFLKLRDYIISDPSQDVQYAKTPKTLPRGILTKSEARRIINAPDKSCTLGYRDKTIMEVLYTTGIRKEELNNLTLNDVDYNDGFLRVIQGKGNKDRITPLGRISCRYLENYINSVRPDLIKDPYNNHLFLSSRGNRLSANVVWELVKKYAKKAKVKKNVSPHTFRHTCATAMLKNKADIRAVQELLGHESLDTTQVYTRVTINDLKEVHARCHPREKDKE
jgi:integrase/recombinase XerD